MGPGPGTDMDLKERAIKGFVGLGSYKLAGQTLSWVLSLALARLLAPDAYGLMALGVFFINFFNFVSEFGLSSALIQRERLEEDEVQSAFWFMAVANLALYLLLAAAAGPIAAYYRQPELAAVIRVLGLNFLISSVRTIPMCLLTRDLRFEQGARADLYSHVTASLTVVGMAYAGLGVWSLVLGAVLQNVLSAAWHLRYRPWRPRPVFLFARVRAMLGYGVSVNASKMLSYVVENADNLVVGRVLGARLLGLYNMAFVVGTLPIQKVAPIIFHISFPVFSRLQHDVEASRRYFLAATRYIALGAVPALVGLALVADSFVPVVLGERWRPMVTPLRMLCVVGVLKALAVTLSPVLYARDRAGVLLRYAVGSALLMPLAFITGARFGIAGVAAAWLAVYPLLFAYLLRLVLRELRLGAFAYLWNLAWVGLGVAAMIVAVAALQAAVEGPPALRLLLASALGAAVYAAVILSADRTLADEVRGAFVVLRRKPQAGVTR